MKAPRWLLTIALALGIFVASSIGGLLGNAIGYSNGQLPLSARAPVHAYGGLKVTLRDDAARAWNVMANCALRQGVDLGFNGPRSAYRSLAEQVYFWHLYQTGQGNLAAYPGTSNHGNGTAGDLPPTSVRWVRLLGRGRPFGWSKVEAWSESWHHNYVGHSNPPDPGPSVTFPVLRIGSGGPCLAPAVRELQARLKIKPASGYFGPQTSATVALFERTHGWRSPDGVVTYATWAKLRQNSAARTGQSYLHFTRPPMIGQDVRALQGKLNARFKEMGYRTRVTVDGVFGQDTGSAVKLFQRARGIKVSGVVGPATQKALSTPTVAAAPTLPDPNPATKDPPAAAPLEPRTVLVKWSPNQGDRWTGVGAIVVHTTEGWYGLKPMDGLIATCDYFANPAPGGNPKAAVSAHVTIDALGESCRSVPDTRRAWHAGRHNTYTLGIEQIGTENFTRAQWLARRGQLDGTAAWIAYWATKYRIPIARCVTDSTGNLKVHGVCSHAQLDPAHRRDPGSGFPWDYVLSKAASLAGATS